MILTPIPILIPLRREHHKDRKLSRADDGIYGNELSRSRNILCQENASNTLNGDVCELSSRPKKGTSKGAHRRLSQANFRLQTDGSKGPQGRRENRPAVVPTNFGRR